MQDSGEHFYPVEQAGRSLLPTIVETVVLYPRRLICTFPLAGKNGLPAESHTGGTTRLAETPVTLPL